MSSFLVVQSNNVGDAVLATPLIHALRDRFPGDRLDVLTSGYAAPILQHQLAIDRVHAYRKLKHRGRDASIAALARDLSANAALLNGLRDQRYDFVFLGSGCSTRKHLRMARWIAPRVTVGLYDARLHASRPWTRRLWLQPVGRSHIVAQSMTLLWNTLGAEHRESPSPAACPCRVAVDWAALHGVAGRVASAGLRAGEPIVALQISARRAKQQWRPAHVIETARRLHRELGVQLLLLWSPGDARVPTHPGHDREARMVAAGCADVPLVACPTPSLPEAIAALSLANVVVSPDGGAMHLAAALHRPVVGLFGDADPALWHPWCTAYRVLREGDRDVDSIEPARIVDAVIALMPAARAAEDAASTLQAPLRMPSAPKARVPE